MTYIPLAVLNERRAQGLSPQGGPAPLDALLQALSPSIESKTAKLDALLGLQWNHPNDASVMARVFELVGPGHSRAEVLIAAGYAHNTEKGREVSEIERGAYARLVASL